MEQRLIERIRNWEKSNVRRTRTDPKKVLDSVLSHLQRILNTRQGSPQISDEYGIPDFTGFMHSYPESLRDLERSIRRTIRMFEPRLQAVRVNFIQPDESDVLSLRFQIMGRLAAENDRMAVMFESQMDSDGKIRIR